MNKSRLKDEALRIGIFIVEKFLRQGYPRKSVQLLVRVVSPFRDPEMSSSRIISNVPGGDKVLAL